MNIDNNSSVSKFDVGIPASIMENVYNTQGDNSKWARLVLTWNEQLKDPQGKLTGEVKEHKYVPLINRETGGMWIDCRPQKIFWKFLLTSMGHSLHGFVKWGTHVRDIIKKAHADCNPKGPDAKRPSLKDRTIIGLKCLKDLAIESAKSALYSPLLTVISVVGVVFAFLAVITTSKWLENRVYDIREFSGKVENEWTKGDKWNLALAPCFQPMKELKSLRAEMPTGENDPTIKEYGRDGHMRALNIFVQRNIEFRRGAGCGFFNDTWTYEKGKLTVCHLDSNITYKSTSYGCSMAAVVYQKNIKPLLVNPEEHQAFKAKAKAWSTV